MARNVTMVESNFVLPMEKEWYPATLMKVEDGRSKFGATFKFVFELSVDEDEEEGEGLNGNEVNALTSAAPSLKNFCGTIIRVLNGMSKDEALGETFNVDELIGTACEVFMSYKESGQGGKFANVTNIRLPTGRTCVAPADGWGADEEEKPKSSGKKKTPPKKAPPKKEPEPDPEPEENEEPSENEGSDDGGESDFDPSDDIPF